MQSDDIAVLAQLLDSMKDALEKLEEAEKSKDSEKLNMAKREILSFQKQIDKVL